MTRKLKRIEPFKFGLIVGIVYGLFSLVFVPIFLLSFVVTGLAALHSGSHQQMPAAIIGVVLGLVFVVFVPILYAVLGGLMGMLGAWLYNVVAGWVGGIEFEVE